MLIGATAYGQASAPVTAADVIEGMVRSEKEQEKNLPLYRTIREYRLANGDGTKAVQVIAGVGFDAKSGKTITVLQESGAEGIFRRVIRKVLEAEERASRNDGDEMRLSPANYDFKLMGSETRDGRLCHVLQLLPKKKSKFLIDGKIWVDAQEYALVRLEGRPAASLSFWVGKPLITQSFQRVGNGMWLMSRNESSTNAKLFGRVTFTMELKEVQAGGTKLAVSRPPNKSRAD